MIDAAKSPLIARAGRGLSGTLKVPGDKSISHRALLLGGLACGETTISGLLEGDDVRATAAALEAMGVAVRRDGDGVWHVHGRGVGGFCAPETALDFGNAGTGVRLMMGVLASQPVRAELTGDASLCARPMNRVLAPLIEMGAHWKGAEGGRLPGTLTGSRDPAPIVYDLPVASAQVKSAVLLAGLNTPGRTSVIERTATRDHTERMLKGFGAAIETTTADGGATAISVDGFAELEPRHVDVPADPSSAAFPLVAALIVEGSGIVLEDVLVNRTRNGLIETLIEMGGDLAWGERRDAGGEEIADLHVRASALSGVDVPADRAPSMIDEYPVLAVAAACAEGTTRLRGLSELRVKESDRLSAVSAGLAACGVEHEVEGDDLIVHGAGTGGGGIAGGGTVATHMDHRIAMAFLIAGLAAKAPVTVDDGAMIATSFPGFVERMTALGADITGPPADAGP